MTKTMEHIPVNVAGRSARFLLPFGASLFQCGCLLFGLTLIGLLIGCTGHSHATPPPPTPVSPYWANTFNGPANGSDEAYAICRDQQGNVYTTGYQTTGTSGDPTLVADTDALVIKYDANGIKQWAATCSDTEHVAALLYSAMTDGEGNLIAAGTWQHADGTQNPLLVKFDPAGHLLWRKPYLQAEGMISKMTLDASGNILVGGAALNALYNGSNSPLDFLVAKYGPDGTLIWAQTFNGSSDDRDVVYALTVDHVGNLYVAGTVATLALDGSGLVGDACTTIKYAPDGTRLWVASYQNPALPPDWGNTPHGIVVDSKGGVIVSGWAGNGLDMGDVLTIKYDAYGTEQWVQLYHNTVVGGSSNGSIFIGVDKGDNVYVAGDAVVLNTPENWFYDFLALKYSPTGAQLWVTTVDGGQTLSDAPEAAALDWDGNLYITGIGNFNRGAFESLTAKVNPDGVVVWAVTHLVPQEVALPPELRAELPSAICLDPAGDVFITGLIKAANFTWDTFTMKNPQLIPQKATQPRPSAGLATEGANRGARHQPVPVLQRHGANINGRRPGQRPVAIDWPYLQF